jgi:hypothetical protein
MRVVSLCPRCSWHVRYASDSDRIGAWQRTVAMCQKATFALQQISLFDHFVGGDGDAKALR